MIEALGDPSLRRPLTHSKPPGTSEKKNGLGHVVPNFDRGEVFLTARRRDGVQRVHWGDDTKDRRRALPAGTYRIKGYRIVRKDKKGASWFISTTSPKGARKLRVSRGETASLKVKSDIHLTVHGKKQGEELFLRAAIRGEKQMGLSIYRDGKRIPIGYRVLDGNGEVIATGNMTYG